LYKYCPSTGGTYSRESAQKRGGRTNTGIRARRKKEGKLHIQLVGKLVTIEASIKRIMTSRSKGDWRMEKLTEPH